MFAPPPTLEAQSAPDRPTGLAASAGDHTVTLTWTDPSDSNITRYEYQVNHNDTGTGNLSGWSTWKNIPGSDSSTTTYTFTGLTNGKEYRYKIRAVVEIGEGNDAPSKPAPGADPWYVTATPVGSPPPPPPPPQVTQFWTERVCDHHFRVRWHRVSGATGYDLNLSRTHRKSWERKMTNKNYNAWQFSQWDKDGTYWLAIRAVNAHGASEWTDVQSVAPPCPVEGLQASYAANGDVSVSWNAAKRASHYDVNFSSDAGKSWERMGSNVSATTYSFNRDPQTLPYNSNFLVAVQSRKGGMTGPWRNAPILWKLTAGDITATTATLNLPGRSGNWWYQANTGPDSSSCQGPVSAPTKALTGLSTDTTYTYKAYDQSGCNSADRIASVTFTTTGGVSVSNLSETNSGYETVGLDNQAAPFTTGSASAGYTLDSVTIPFAAKGGNPSAISVKIYSDSSGKPDAEVANATFTGPSNPENQDARYTCSGSGCVLLASTTYHLHLSRPGNTGSYRWRVTASDDETNAPSTAGWSIGNGGHQRQHGFNDWQPISGSRVGKFKVAATVTFVTGGVSVSNLSETNSGYESVGSKNQASPFTTGSASGGYTLDSVAIPFAAKGGNPGAIVVKIYGDSNGKPDAEVANAAFTGPNHPQNQDAVYTCSGSGCALSASTTYHLYLSRPGNTGHYRWRLTDSDAETNAPSTAGWSIGNGGHQRQSGFNDWQPVSGSRVGKFKVAATVNNP